MERIRASRGLRKTNYPPDALQGTLVNTSHAHQIKAYQDKGKGKKSRREKILKCVTL